MKTNHIISEFSALSHQEKERLIEYLIDQWETGEGQMLRVMQELEETRIGLPHCVHCQSEKTWRRAKINGIQRYSCKSCGKYWMATHGTSLAGLQKKSLWQKYIKSFLKGLSIRNASAEVGVCIQTSFRWRHRLLSAISCYLPQSVGGVIESADFQIPFSRKGQKIDKTSEADTNETSAETDPQSVSILLSVCRGTQESISSIIKTTTLNKDQIQKALSGKILHGSVHITEFSTPFVEFNNSEVVENLYVKTKHKPGKRERIHLKTVLKNQEAFLKFLSPFKGVATKYLQNYLNWYHYKNFLQKRYDKLNQTLITSISGGEAIEWLENLTIKDTIIIT